MDEGNVLLTIKKLIGFNPEYEHFDLDILVQINAAADTLYQIGLKQVVDRIDFTTSWDDLEIADGVKGMIKDYIYMYVKHAFDPPASSSVMKAIENQIKEFEWRINVALDNFGVKEETNA